MDNESSQQVAALRLEEFRCAQRLAYRAATFSDRLMSQNASADDLDASATRILEAAVKIAKGLEPDQPIPKYAPPGALPTDWAALTGKTLDQLIYEAQIRAVSDGHFAIWEREGTNIPWKRICEIILKPIEAQQGTDTYRAGVAHLADHMKPSRIAARYSVVDGWKKFNIGDATLLIDTNRTD